MQIETKLIKKAERAGILGIILMGGVFVGSNKKVLKFWIDGKIYLYLYANCGTGVRKFCSRQLFPML